MSEPGGIEAAVARLSLKIYDDFAPIRAFVAEHPEFKDVIVRAFADSMSQAFAADFYGDQKWWSK